MHIAAREGDESRPVWSRRMPARMLPEGYVAIDKRRLHRRKLVRPHIVLPSSLYTGPAPAAARNMPFASTQPSPFSSAPPLMNTGRGAHNATNSCASMGRSFQCSGPPYLMKLPAIQWYSSTPVMFSTNSPQFATIELGSPLARRTDITNGKSLIVSHSHDRGPCQNASGPQCLSA